MSASNLYNICSEMQSENKNAANRDLNSERRGTYACHSTEKWLNWWTGTSDLGGPIELTYTHAVQYCY